MTEINVKIVGHLKESDMSNEWRMFMAELEYLCAKYGLNHNAKKDGVLLDLSECPQFVHLCNVFPKFIVMPMKDVKELIDTYEEALEKAKQLYEDLDDDVFLTAIVGTYIDLPKGKHYFRTDYEKKLIEKEEANE